MTILITGATSGIGRQVATQLAVSALPLIVVGRDVERGDALLADLRGVNPDGQVEFVQADLTRMCEVQALAERLVASGKDISGVVHCAGVMLPKRTLTDEGLEPVFAVQYLARWLLTERLIPVLRQVDRAFVISVSAGGMFPFRLDWENLMGEKRYDGALALIHESIANDMAMIRYQQLEPSIDFYCYGPFWVPGTSLMSAMPTWFQRLGDVGAALFGYTPEAAATDVLNIIRQRPDTVLIGRKLRVARPTAWKSNASNLERLWQLSAQLTSNALGST